jgi:hypothetical protein
VAEEEDFMTETPKKKKAKKVQRFSDFVHKNKFNSLLEGLKRARDEDPYGKTTTDHEEEYYDYD